MSLPLVFVFATAAAGILVLLYEIVGLMLRLRFGNDYLRRFSHFVNDLTPGLYNTAEYDWLLRRSQRMQADLGGPGVADYKPAGSTTFIPGYRILLNNVASHC